MVDYLPSTIESLRATILRLGLLNEGDLIDSLADCRQHLAKPEKPPLPCTPSRKSGAGERRARVRRNR